ncbi:MAG: ribose-phosphate pyrophosphokinase [Methyloversatilis sp.]|jgi:ribose-phosphate pyrophosphokinase|nr:ribose-phosphate pyrophosphokinase [Methyloversatilis sp.]MBP6193285.1 ribose-phosphate pyrophosphokinase [Methyloversatilis sp.]MBP9117244.1 ribose-phosphate pyrophosphokinase [Methyloversatilis sp.]
MTQPEPCLFAPGSNRTFAEAVCRHLGTTLGEHDEKAFSDGEFRTRLVTCVRGKDVFVIQSLHGDAQQSTDEKLLRLLFFIATAVDAGAARVSAVVPYLCYARQDRRSAPGDPVATRHVARLLEASGAGRMATVDIHNPSAFDNAFRIPAMNIMPGALLADFFARSCAGTPDDPAGGHERNGLAGALRERPLVVVAPDSGAIPRAAHFRELLSYRLDADIDSAFIEKHRSDSGLGGTGASGHFAGRTALIVDDMICTGATTLRAARICRERGAERVIAAATHAVLSGNAASLLCDPVIDAVVVSNTIPVPDTAREVLGNRLHVLDAGRLCADAIGVMGGAC